MGAGQVDLGAQRLDYTVTPKALRVNASRGGLAVPVRIRGPWADPEIKADLRAAVDAIAGIASRTGRDAPDVKT